jgi:hypothetical protein
VIRARQNNVSASISGCVLKNRQLLQVNQIISVLKMREQTFSKGKGFCVVKALSHGQKADFNETEPSFKVISVQSGLILPYKERLIK